MTTSAHFRARPRRRRTSLARAALVAACWLLGASLVSSTSPLRRPGPIAFAAGVPAPDAAPGGAAAPGAAAPNPAHTVGAPAGEPIAPVSATPGPDGRFHVSLAQLSAYPYRLPSESDMARIGSDPARFPDPIPPAILALAGKPVAVDGFILPIDMGAEVIRRFVLSPSVASCCWGGPTKVNDWIDIHVSDAKLGRRLMTLDQALPVRVWGKLEVGPKIVDGFVESLYRMALDDVRPRPGP
ncbi:MAG: DUF3299 domain-containing protein [Deltaproteobacteria bacterium]|nr:DUF3299 domain-containing protein [Deltaproteobacteria bacterium]